MDRSRSLLRNTPLVTCLIASCALTDPYPSGVRGEQAGDAGLDALAEDAPSLDVSADADAPPMCDEPLTLCGGVVCADLESNEEHCGGCDRACAPANALGSCDEGICTIASCANGFEDKDGDPNNGCELDLRPCIDGAACVTSCGSSGTVACGVAGEGGGVCQVPAEVCNLADESCDGMCDEGVPDCKLNVYRFSGMTGTPDEYQFYTLVEMEGASDPTLVARGSFSIYAEATEGASLPLYLCAGALGGGSVVSTQENCEGAMVGAGIRIGFVGASELDACGARPLYGALLQQGNLISTTDLAEYQALIQDGALILGKLGVVW